MVKIRATRRSVRVSAVVVAVLSMLPLWLMLWVCTSDPLVVGEAIVVGIFVALLVSEVMLYKVDDALLRIEKILKKIASGDLSARAYTTNKREVVPLVRAVNSMASSFQRSVEELTQSSAEQDAILRTMVEGVITVAPDGTIRTANDAAKKLLELETKDISGARVEDALSHAEVRQFVVAALGSPEPSSATVKVRGQRERLLELNASPLLSDNSVAAGTLIVIHDVTRLQKLENVRRDFVANVSHELRTPITSIKGFVETLVDGAMHDPEALKKFLAIIGRQAERLNSIFNDLLTLARLEAGGEDARVDTEVKNVGELVRQAVEDCARRAEERRMQVVVEVPDGLIVHANPSLVEQALVNLVDNAIKYSEVGDVVKVTGRREGDFAEIMVQDTGPGINKEHLSRLFERFYRIDQGRSRQLGGTGLGLAIVKHIAQVHGGKVAVSSVVGQGSCFSFFLRSAA